MSIHLPAPRSGGIMANYTCSSRCRHCAYYCGPEWSNDYIDEQSARATLSILRELGCSAVHIGGGEPCLRQDNLVRLIRWCGDEGVGVDYVETNASWYHGNDASDRFLVDLRSAGLQTLLISISPFHNEYIPWKKTRRLIEACGRAGISVFPWVEGFIPELASLDPEVVHELSEYESAYGEGYLRSLPSRYWISPRGRAVETFRPFMDRVDAATIVRRNSEGCRELFDTSHFHADLYGNYIPGVCSGLAVSIQDLAAPFEEAKYPYITALMTGGIGSLLEIARREYGFVPDVSYSGKCDLCYDIRRHLVVGRRVSSPDLQPSELYRMIGPRG